MKLSKLVIAATVVAAGAASLSTGALAQAKEQFPAALLPHRPLCAQRHGVGQDYLKMINARDGGPMQEPRQDHL